MTITRITAVLLLAACAARGQIAVRWLAEASRTAPQEIAVYRGETLALEPTVTVHGEAYAWPDGTAVTLYWQTNGMAASWWSAPAALGTSTGALRAVWSPACDAGAERYTFFIRAAAPSGTAYRASGTLRMIHSPGAVPNALALPVPVLDFSAVSVLNPPWPSAADLQAASNALAAALQPLGPRLDLIEGCTNAWQTAYGWGDHALAGYLLPAALAPYATTQQVAQAAASKLDASAAAGNPLRAEWSANVYEDAGHLRIFDSATEDAVFLGPRGIGQWRNSGWEYPQGIDRFVDWFDIPERSEIAAASNNLAGVIGALTAADVGALPSQSTETQLRVDWHPDVYGTGGEGHLRIYDPLTPAQNAVYFGPLGFGQYRGDDLDYPYGIDRFVLWTDLATLPDLDGATNAIVQSYLLGSATTPSIIAPLYESGTNVTVTSTQSVYSVSVTDAGPIGIDWSGLSLDGTGRAEVTLRLNVTEWGGTNVTFSPSLTFDQTPEILVTGVWEFAASTVDGTTTRIRQTWPEVVECNVLVPQVAFGGSASLGYGGNRLQTLGTGQDGLIQYYWPLCAADVVMVRIDAAAAQTSGFPLGSFCDYRVEGYNVSISPIVTNRCEITVSNTNVGGPVTTFRGTAKISEVSVSSMIRLRRLILSGDPSSTNAHVWVNAAYRELNANERAAYEAGWRP